MTTTHPTRQEADAWWESLDRIQRECVWVWARHQQELFELDARAWWRSLPDERAVTIYMSERA